MGKQAKPWIVSYWDTERDWEVKIRVATHEHALRKQAWAKARGHNNVRITHKAQHAT